MVDTRIAEAFLEQHRLAVVGASEERGNFGRTVCRALRGHGHEVVAVHPSATEVDGLPCYPDLASVPERPDGVVVVVSGDAAVDVVEHCAERGVRWVWLFRGLGGPGAATDEAVARCHHHGMEVVDGACPMMFLPPVGFVHRLHRAARRRNGSVVGLPRAS